MLRTSREVALQAMIYGALGSRASLEVTDHPRAASFCSQLLPWLEQLTPDIEIAEFHREILSTPHQNLPREFQIEAYWRGESASLLGWAVHLCDRPDPEVAAHSEKLFYALRILQPNARELIAGAQLRSRVEIEDFCAFCMMVRQERQVPRLKGDKQDLLKNLHQKRLHEFGLSDAVERLQKSDVEALAASTRPGIVGLYVARAVTAEWLLGEDD